jgi:D-3-phosphoglycerate dehydrogenase
MEKYKLLIEARPFCVCNQAPMKKLKDNGFDISDMRGSGIENKDFLKALKSADAVLCGNELQIDEQFFQLAPNVKIVAKMGVGVNNIDIPAATKQGVLICDTPGVNQQSVADHTFALILSVARFIVPSDQSLRDKRWEHTKILCHEVWNKTLGLIGLGAIGQNVALRAKGFQMKVVAFDPFWPTDFAKEHGIVRVSIEKLLKESDIVSLHIPLTPETLGIIDKKALNLMKSNAILINTSRGGIINESDLFDALKNKVIAGAGLDVFEEEPPVDSPLLDLNNIVMTPHTAAFTYDAIREMNNSVVKQLIEFIQGNQPCHALNPEVFSKIQVNG